MLCDKCGKLAGLLVLALGIIFLLQDLAIFSFWGIKWSTAVLILIGLSMLTAKMCPECRIDAKKRR